MFYGNQALVVAFYKQKAQVSINIQLHTCIKHMYKTYKTAYYKMAHRK